MRAKAEITVIENAAADLAEFVVVGPVTADDIIAIAQNHPSFKMRKHLVDMTQTDFHMLDQASLERISDAFSEIEHVRPLGGTAIVVHSDMDAIIAKMYSAISDHEARQEVFKITLSRDEALSWLSEQDS